jgi:predicted aspartyl protease
MQNFLVEMQAIGIKPVEVMEFTSISNQKMKREVGTAYISAEGRTWLTNIIFGEEHDVEVLGVTTLEQLALQVDPVSGTLKPLPLYLL